MIAGPLPRQRLERRPFGLDTLGGSGVLAADDLVDETRSPRGLPKPPRGGASHSPRPAPQPICSAAWSAASNRPDRDRRDLCPRNPRFRKPPTPPFPF